MERLEAFEKMLNDIRVKACEEDRKLEELKTAGKEKTATYKQYYGNKVFYRMILDKYRQYGLLDEQEKE